MRSRLPLALLLLCGTACPRTSSVPPAGALRPGDAAPVFPLRTHDGRAVSLADFRGKKVLLWFYPAADTPG